MGSASPTTVGGDRPNHRVRISVLAGPSEKDVRGYPEAGVIETNPLPTLASPRELRDFLNFSQSGERPDLFSL
jgi:hypothetical protein